MNVLNIIRPAATVRTAAATLKTSVESQAERAGGRGSVTRGIFFRRTTACGRRFHDVIRAPLHFVVNPAEIFAEHADPDELHATEEEHDRDQRGVTGGGGLDAEDAADGVERGGGESH